MIQKNEPQFFTEKEVAKQLRVTLPTLKMLRDTKQIDFIKLGSAIRYPRHVFNGKLKMEGVNND
jgi:excisionase family DNA binding protein